MYLYLLKGFEISNIKYHNIYIKTLYIKIDKKIIFKSKNINIHITPTKNDNDIISTYKQFKKLLQYLAYFQTIDIQNLNINTSHISKINYNNKILSIDTKKINIKTYLYQKNNQTYFTIYHLIFKPKNIQLNNLSGFFKPTIFYLYLHINTKYKDALIKINAKLSNKNISYSGKILNITNSLLTSSSRDLPSFNIPYLSFWGDLDKVAFEISGIRLKTNNLNLKTTICSGNIDINKQTASLKTQAIKIFNKNIKILSKNNSFSFKNNTLSFASNILANYKNIQQIKIPNIKAHINTTSHEGTIQTKKITYKTITINNLKAKLKNNKIFVNATSDTLFSKNLTKILNLFAIKTNIYQTNGENKIDLQFLYNLTTNKLQTNIFINSKDSIIHISPTIKIYIKKANIALINNVLNLTNSDISFKKSIISVNYHITSGQINLKKHFIKTNGIIQKLNIKNIGTITNYPEDFYMNLKTMNISLANLATNIQIDKNITININRLSTLFPYIEYMKKYKIDNGKISLNIGEITKITAELNTSNDILYYKNKPLKHIKANIIIDKNLIKIKNKKIDLTIDKNLTFLKGNYKNLDINITKFYNPNDTNSSTPIKKINISAKNTYIFYQNHKIYSDTLSINKNLNNLKIISNYKKRKIMIVEQNKTKKIYGLNIKDKTFYDLFGNNIIKNTTATFFALQTPKSKNWSGFVKFDGGYISGLIALQNIMAFINLVPSLATFEPVGFSNKGYKIKSGYINYIYCDKILYIKKAILKGLNINFSANGYLNFKDNTIKMNVDADLLIKLIKDIPVVNYILLGKDGGITIHLTLTGNIDDPKVNKNGAENIILAPLGIIKRTLLTPFRPFMDK